jgi:hypothetical protein
VGLKVVYFGLWVVEVSYILISEFLFETPDWYGSALLVRGSWLRSTSDLEFENLRRNGIAEST